VLAVLFEDDEALGSSTGAGFGCSTEIDLVLFWDES